MGWSQGWTDEVVELAELLRGAESSAFVLRTVKL